MRKKQSREHRCSQIGVVRFGYAGVARRRYRRGLNGAKPSLADPAERRNRALRFRQGDEQEDGVERGAGLDQAGKPPALLGRSVERQAACGLPQLVFEQPADMRETIEQSGQIGSVGRVHGQTFRNGESSRKQDQLNRERHTLAGAKRIAPA